MRAPASASVVDSCPSSAVPMQTVRCSSLRSRPAHALLCHRRQQSAKRGVAVSASGGPGVGAPARVVARARAHAAAKRGGCSSHLRSPQTRRNPRPRPLARVRRYLYHGLHPRGGGRSDPTLLILFYVRADIRGSKMDRGWSDRQLGLVVGALLALAVVYAAVMVTLLVRGD